MKYLKYFETEAEYNAYRNGSNFITPNVSHIVELAHLPAGDPRKAVMFNPKSVSVKAEVGDIAYWNGSVVKFCTLDKWDNSLGTPVGVCVIPTGFAPDGKPRIIGLKPADISGSGIQLTRPGIKWTWNTANTLLTDYTKVPTTDNTGSSSVGSDSYGYLPSDKFTGSQSYVDSEAKYNGSTPLIPSPYLGDKPNPEYYKEISGNNVLSDFNGLSNTEYLVSLGSDYDAANAAWNYSDGVSNLQWYLPAMGELSYLMPRFNKINSSISAVGGVKVASSDSLWSSSEFNPNFAYYLYVDTGIMAVHNKTTNHYVCSFAAV